MNDIKMQLTFTHTKKPYLLDISSLLYDFELIHDLLLICYVNTYETYKFTNYFLFREGRPTKEHHQIRVLRITKESPFEIILVFSGAFMLSGALLALLKIIKMIKKWKLDDKKAVLEVKKLESEIKTQRYKEFGTKAEWQNALEKREALYLLKSILRKIEKNPIVLQDLNILSHRDNQKNQENEKQQ